MLRRFHWCADRKYGQRTLDRKAERQFVATVGLVGYDHATAMMSAAAVMQCAGTRRDENRNSTAADEHLAPRITPHVVNTRTQVANRTPLRSGFRPILADETSNANPNWLGDTARRPCSLTWGVSCQALRYCIIRTLSD